MKRLKLFSPIFWGVLQLNWSSSYPPAHPSLALEEIFSASTSAFISSFLLHLLPTLPSRNRKRLMGGGEGGGEGRGGEERVGGEGVSVFLLFFLCHRSAPLRQETLPASRLMNVVFVCHAYQSTACVGVILMRFLIRWRRCWWCCLFPSRLIVPESWSTGCLKMEQGVKPQCVGVGKVMMALEKKNGKIKIQFLPPPKGSASFF